MFTWGKAWIVHRPQVVVCTSITWRGNSKILIIYNTCLEHLELGKNHRNYLLQFLFFSFTQMKKLRLKEVKRPFQR